jgi:hypothetical protein
MMSYLNRFQVVLMPEREVVASGLTMSEAVAFISGYEEVSEPGGKQAVIALGSPPELAASARRLRRATQAGRSLPSLRLA